MRLKFTLPIIGLCLFFLMSCADRKGNTVDAQSPIIEQPEEVEVPQVTNELLKSIIVKDTATKSVAVEGLILFSQKSLPLFYADTDYKLGWTSKSNRNDLLASLESADDEGLTPEDYHLEKIKELVAKGYENLNEAQKVNLDLYLTDAVLLYGSHLRLGKVDQKVLRTQWDVGLNKEPAKVDSLLVEALKSKTIKEGLEGVKPGHSYYKTLKEQLQIYKDIETNGGWKTVSIKDKLEEGDTSEVILELADRLQITGDLGDYSLNDSIYNDVLKEAVIKFQKRHNLTADGVLGKGTVEQLNVPIEDRINSIRINLERLRWVLDEHLNDFLMVNIAGFDVRRIKNGKMVFKSRVIVGKYHKETPIFRDTMQYIIMNPTWTLPYSIAVFETLPRLKKNPGYLAAKHMQIMNRSGQVLNPNNIDFKQYGSGNFPFTIRQKAGPWNALGEVKFIFPNKYSVYLHDTPSRSLFDRQDRAFSHGCIRTEDKWGLLLSLMEPTGEWDMDRINEVLKSGKTTKINLPEPINIYLLYYTAGVNENNQLRFIKDVYKRDKAVLTALDAPVSFKKHI